MHLVLIFVGYTLIGLYEGLPLVKSKNKRVLFAYILIFLVAFILSILLSIGVHLPSPATVIEKVIQAITGMLSG